MGGYSTDDIIFALATAWARSALAVIRVSGEGCLQRLSPCFSRPKSLLEARDSTLVHGYLVDETGVRLDEVVAAIHTEGHGYTAEESVEFSCHGSPAGIERILALFGRMGLRQASGGEFTFRAFLHGRMDLTQAEAVREVVDSQSAQSQSMALSRLDGALGKRIGEARELLLGVVAAVEVQLDYAEDELDAFVFPREQLLHARRIADTLEATYSVGHLYGVGAKVVLAGPVNAGKSSLFNLLLKQHRSIVSTTEGTTRDYIESSCIIDGIPVRLFDTAGLRTASDVVESEGIRRTAQLMEHADLVVYMVDGNAPEARIPDADDHTLVVYNKNDSALPPEGALSISAVTGDGLTTLLDRIGARLHNSVGSVAEGQVVVESERQHRLLQQASASMGTALDLVDRNIPLDIVASELGEALHDFGELTGEVTPADILEKIFSGFCVGK